MIHHYEAERGITGYAPGDILVPDVGPRTRAVETGAGTQLEPLPPDAGSACDRCGAFISDLDAGFSVGLRCYQHDCGGTWRAIGAEAGT